MGFFNYVSPRARREAKSQVVDIQKLSHTMYTSLLNARRTDAVSLSLQAQKAQDELQKAQRVLTEKDAYIARLQSELSNKA